jgi:hypothetical protein
MLQLLRRTAVGRCHSRLLSSQALECDSLLATLDATPPGTLPEAKALRALWRHLQASPSAEPQCSTCDCGEPCDDPVTDWALQGTKAQHRALWRGAHRVEVQAAHEKALQGAPPPLDGEAGAELPFTASLALLLRASTYTTSKAGLTFADLGAGVGRPALTAALLPQFFGTVLGWEQVPRLHAASVTALDALRTPAAVTLTDGDAASDAAVAAWRRADVVLFHAPLDGHFAHAVGAAAEAMQPGTVLLSVGGVLPGTPRSFQLLERRRLPLSWGMGTVFLSRKLVDDDGHDDDVGGLPGAHDDTPDIQLLRRDPRGLARLLAAMGRHAAAPQAAAEAACAAALAAKSELAARRLCAPSAGGVRALAEMLAVPGNVHLTASALLALHALAAHSCCAHALTDTAVPALVDVLRTGVSGGGAPAVPPGILAAAASSLADIASAEDDAVDAMRAVGALPVLRTLLAQDKQDAADGKDTPLGVALVAALEAIE